MWSAATPPPPTYILLLFGVIEVLDDVVAAVDTPPGVLGRAGDGIVDQLHPQLPVADGLEVFDIATVKFLD